MSSPTTPPKYIRLCNHSVHHRGLSLSKTRNNISISALQIRLKVVTFDAEKQAFSMWGVNAMEIPGMSLGALAILMGELGSGFTEKFTSAKSFCKWCNLVPNNKKRTASAVSQG